MSTTPRTQRGTQRGIPGSIQRSTPQRNPERVDPAAGRKRAGRDQIVLDTDVYTLARQRMAHVFDTFDTVIVAFSGGKDSTAVLNVALDTVHTDARFARHLPLKAVFFDEEAIPYETEAYVRRVAQRPDVDLTWYCLPIQHRNACSRKHPYWWPWAPESQALWCRPMPPEAVTTLDGFPIWPPEARLTNPDLNGLLAPYEYGNTALLMGIRAQESLIRHRAVTRVGSTGTNWIMPYIGGTNRGNLWKAYPVYDWTTRDVWTAPAHFGWDFNAAYNHLEMAGVPHHLQRCSPAFGEEPLQKIHTYASCFPDVWAKMVDRVPGVGAAGRYALTELYCYRDRPEKPPGMTWPEFLTHYLVKHDLYSAKVAARVRESITRHYRNTADPLVFKAKHPASGCSFDFLLMLAMRGDFKKRKQETGAMPRSDDFDGNRKIWRKYADELASIITSGAFGELGHPRPAPADPYALIPPMYR